MATCACVVLGLSSLALLRGWDAFASSSDRLLFVAIAVLALLAAGFFLRILRRGRSLAAIHDSEGEITSMISAAVLGDPQAVVDLQHFREDIRKRVEVLDLLPPPLRARVRGAYSVTVTALIQALTDFGSPLVKGSTNDDGPSKETVVNRLEAELAVWKADFAWFERVEDRLPT